MNSVLTNNDIPLHKGGTGEGGIVSVDTTLIASSNAHEEILFKIIYYLNVDVNNTGMTKDRCIKPTLWTWRVLQITLTGLNFVRYIFFLSELTSLC